MFLAVAISHPDGPQGTIETMGLSVNSGNVTLPSLRLHQRQCLFFLLRYFVPLND